MAIDTLNLKVPVPCVQGFFGDRLVTYTTQIKPSDIYNLLGHDPRSSNWKKLPDSIRQVYEYLQRKTSKDRRDSIAGYIEERLGPDHITIGAFPSISIGVREPLEFEPYEAEGKSDIPKAVGRLQFDLSPSSERVLLDGLGRITGALDLIDDGQGDLVQSFVFPTTIFAPRPGSKPLSFQELGQLFHDFNFKVAPVAKAHAVALDQSDLYISLANHLAHAAFIEKNGGTALRAASLGKKSTELVVQTVLVRMVRGACEGAKFQESDRTHVDAPNLTRETFHAFRDSISEHFTEIANRMGSRFSDRDSIHLTSPGWQALGVLHHDIWVRLRLSKSERQWVYDAIGAIDWSRNNPDWIPMLGTAEISKMSGQPVVDSKGRPRVALGGSGRNNRQRLIDYLRAKTRIADRLSVLKDGTDDTDALTADNEAA